MAYNITNLTTIIGKDCMDKKPLSYFLIINFFGIDRYLISKIGESRMFEISNNSVGLKSSSRANTLAKCSIWRVP